jgi:hypothetical protein
MSGAIAGSPGTLPTGWGWDNALPVGMTKSISNTGTENGLPYVDVTISGTAGAAGYEALTFTTSGLTAMSAGQTWTASSFFRTVSGVIPAGSSLYMRYETSVGATTQDSAVSIALLSSAFQRVSTTNTNAPATTANGRSFLLWSFANGLTYNFTLRIYAPQLELGAFASAPILTTSGAATVNGNQQVVDLTGRLSAGVGGIIQVNLLGAENDFVRVIEFNDGTGSNYVMVRRNVTGLQMLVTASGVPTAQFEIQTFTLGPQTIAFAASPNYAMARAVGQSAPTADVTVTYPTITRVSFGGEGFGTFNNMYQLTRRVALRFGAQNASTFADLFSKATILAAVS